MTLTPDNRSVYLFDQFKAKPVFHRYGRYDKLDDGRLADITICGLVMYDGQILYAAHLRWDHAALFGRACRKCFPTAEWNE